VTHHVLVVEDEAAILRGVVRSLESDPELRVTGCSSVNEAVPVLGNDPPSLLVTDLSLPGRSGLEMISELDRNGLRIPIVITTAYRARFEPQFPEDAHLVVLEKPVPLQQLRTLIHELLGKPELRRTGPTFEVSDYLQLAGMGRYSVVLRIATRVGAEEGWIEVVDGDVWNAYFGELTGEQALSRMLTLEVTAVSAQALSERPQQRQIEQRLEALLLELVRQIDESRRDRIGAQELEPSPAAGRESWDRREIPELDRWAHDLGLLVEGDADLAEQLPELVTRLSRDLAELVTLACERLGDHPECPAPDKRHCGDLAQALTAWLESLFKLAHPRELLERQIRLGIDLLAAGGDALWLQAMLSPLRHQLRQLCERESQPRLCAPLEARLELSLIAIHLAARWRITECLGRVTGLPRQLLRQHLNGEVAG